MDDIEDADAAAVGQRLDFDESLVIDRDVAGTPAFESVVFLGFCGRPCRGGFGFQGRRLEVSGAGWAGASSCGWPAQGDAGPATCSAATFDSSCLAGKWPGWLFRCIIVYGLAFAGGESVRCVFSFFKSPNTQ